MSMTREEAAARLANRHIQSAMGSGNGANQLTPARQLAADYGNKNEKFIGRDGKEYGWAQQNGEWIPVQWGSVAGIKLDNVAQPVHYNSVPRR